MYFYDCFFLSEFNSDICAKVLYTKKDKFATQIGFVQDKKKNKKNYPSPKTLHSHAYDAFVKFQV